MASKIPAKKQKSKAPKSAKAPNTSWYAGGKLTYLFIALGATLLVFLNALDNGFVNWDDNVNIHENPNLAAFDWNSIKGIFTSDVIGNYNPLPIFTFAIEKAIFGLNPTVFHLTNLVLHLVCTYYVYRILLHFKLSDTAVFIATLLFGLHPMRVESVTWVTERKDVLFGAFFLPALLSYIYYIKGNQKEKRYLYISLVLFVLSLFSKIQAVTLPLTMLAVDYYFKRPLKLNLVLEKWPFFLLALGFGVLGIFVLKDQGSLEDATNYTFFQRLLVGAYSYIVYLIKVIVPYPMVPLYPYPSKLNWMFYAAPLPVLAVLAFLWYAFKKDWKAIVFGFAFFTFNVMFLLQILGAGQGFIADRFTYIPYIGLFFLMAWGYDRIIDMSPGMKTALNGGVLAYGLVLAFLTVRQNNVWQTSETLWTHTIKHYPNTSTAFGNRGHYYRDLKQFQPALADYTKAIEINPKNAPTYNSRAKLYFDNGKSQEALADFNKAIELDSSLAEVYINRGACKASLGQIQAAIEDLNSGLRKDPTNKNGFLNRSLLYFQSGNFAKAVEDHTAYLALDPYNSDIWYERGLSRNGMGQYQEANADLNRAIQLNSGKALYYVERAKSLRGMGNAAAARQDAVTAQQLGAQVPAELLQ